LASNDSFISFCTWESLKKGLLSADRLITDIKTMEAAHLDRDRREREMTKHLSLASFDPYGCNSSRLLAVASSRCLRRYSIWTIPASTAGA
jgi:hypothetical protein